MEIPASFKELADISRQRTDRGDDVDSAWRRHYGAAPRNWARARRIHTATRTGTALSTTDIMQLSVKGKQLDLGEALRIHIGGELPALARPDERRVGKECVRPFKSRGPPVT